MGNARAESTRPPRVEAVPGFVRNLDNHDERSCDDVSYGHRSGDDHAQGRPVSRRVSAPPIQEYANDRRLQGEPGELGEATH